MPLRTDSPCHDWRRTGNLGYTVWRVFTSITLLIPTFALLIPPQLVPQLLHRPTERSATEGKLQVINYKLLFMFSFVFNCIFVIIFKIASISASSEVHWVSEINQEALRSRIQYLVSLASLYAIERFEIKSCFDWAQVASSRFAQIEVPDFKICFERTNSFFSSIRKE